MKILVVCAASGTLLLQGCASSEGTTFTRSNASDAVAQRDAAQCWQQAEKKGVPEDKAAENTAAAFIIGGLVGVGVNRAANEDAYKGSLRDRCMAKRGYAKAKSS